jgi:glutamate-1-semialdehyde 2,1-aminomutase
MPNKPQETASDRYKKSAMAYTEACRLMPGGVNSPVRAFGGVDKTPVFIASAKGSKIYDIDGNEYIDYVGSWGPMILGHTHPKVVAAIKTAADAGASFGAPTLGETALAQKIVGAFPSIEKVRMVSSGTEAVMTAVRLARAYTGRDMIIKMAGGYHGHSDSLLVGAGSGVAEAARAASAGVPADFARLTVVVPYNDIDAVKAVFAARKDKIAAVLVEPVAANVGVIPPQKNYLASLRQLCSANNSVLIFDEVITGFRIAYGGAQQLYGVRADLTCLGKIVGGGLPGAAFGGTAEIMDLLAPLGPVYQAGTLSGNPLACAAANVTLEMLADTKCYQQLEQTAAFLEDELAKAAADVSVAVTINRVGSIMSVFFTDKPVRNYADVQTTDVGRFKKFFAAMLDSGIYLAPSAYEAMFVSLAHTQKDVEKTIEAARYSFNRVN